MDLQTYLDHSRQTQTGLARELGVTQGLVFQWLTGRTQITAERAIDIERATGGAVTRYELRPDVFFEGSAAQERKKSLDTLA